MIGNVEAMTVAIWKAAELVIGVGSIVIDVSVCEKRIAAFVAAWSAEWEVGRSGGYI